MKLLGATVELLAEVARPSPNLQLNEKGDMVKRKLSVPEKDTISDRSVYVVLLYLCLLLFSPLSSEISRWMIRR
jgi:hypothetical protein